MTNPVTGESVSKDKVLAFMGTVIFVLLGALQSITIMALTRMSDKIDNAVEASIRNSAIVKEVEILRAEVKNHTHE